MPRILLALLILLLTTPVSAQPGPWWPGSQYDPTIPTPKAVLGYEIGEYFTEHEQMLDYMRKLEAASPRVKLFSVGRTYERRELVLLAISDPQNMSRLEDIRTTVARLRDPRTTTEAQARDIARTTPAVAWMSFANDGNESAAFEAGIQLAYHLAAGTDDAVRRILKDVVTIVYPAHNPESHSRYVAWMRAVATGDPDPAAREHRGDWLMDTNDNHYHIDLNRDAVFQSQVESQVIVRELHRWNPVVFIDHHGNPDRFFFPPWALPVNAQVDETSRKWVEIYGKDIAKAFDRGGWTYWTRRTYDLHYPGYYDSYPTLNGATGMTFETDGGGNKGLAYRLPDGRVTTLLDGTLHHFTGAVASLLTTAERREARLFDLYGFRASGMVDVAKDKVKQFVLAPGRDPRRAADLVALLLRHQIEVYRARAGFSTLAAHNLLTDEAAKRSFPAGVWVVPANQPQKRLLRTLLDRETPLEDAFLQEVRQAKAYNDSVGENAPKKPYGFYDINAWSLPLAYGVETYWTEDAAPPSSLDAVTAPPVVSTGPEPAKPAFAYVFPWNSRGATRVVNALWKEGYRLSLAREGFTIDGRAFPPGMVVVRLQANPKLSHERIVELARANQVELAAANGAMVEQGRDLGDSTVVDLEAPKVVVVTDVPTSGTAYGATWYLFEQVYDLPFTALRAQDLTTANLSDYNVIVMPDGSAGGYARVLGTEGTSRLQAWVRDGGTLVAVKGAAAWAAGERVNLTTARDKFAAPEGDPKEAEKKDPPKRIDVVPGAFVQVNVDREHYLGTGIDGPVVALFRSSTIFTPTKKGARAGTLDAARPVVAGFFFDDAKPHLPGAPFVWDEPTGRGHVTCFADDVTFRTFLHGAHRLLLNAVMLGPSMRARGGFGGM